MQNTIGKNIVRSTSDFVSLSFTKMEKVAAVYIELGRSFHHCGIRGQKIVVTDLLPNGEGTTILNLQSLGFKSLYMFKLIVRFSTIIKG